MKIIFIILICSINLISQDNLIVIVGDSLKGKVVNGESIREIYGNVVLTQGNVRVTCNKAIQYLTRNDAELIGNVIVTQDNLTIKTPQGYYYGNLRKTYTNSGVTLDDKEVILSASEGEYYFDNRLALFKKNVKLYDTISTLTSETLSYLRDEDKAIAVGNVKIIDPDNTIFADSLIHLRNDQITFAYNNVIIKNNVSNTIVYGNELQDYRTKKYTLIKKFPLMIQIDTIRTKDDDNNDKVFLDTLFISSEIMEVYRDVENKFIATDSVKILKGLFSSINDYTEYFRDSSKIKTYKKQDNYIQPVLWYDLSQLTGDSITIYLEENKIKQLDIDKNSFMLTINEKYPSRFDQSSSSSTKIFFNDNRISKIKFFNNVFSIYYLFDKNAPNGLIKSTSKDAIIYFNNSEISDVKLIGNPNNEYYPENLVESNEKNFLLPKFNLIESKPSKEQMYNKLKKFRWHKH